MAASDGWRRPPALWQRLAASALTCLSFVVVYNGCNYLASLRPNVGSIYFWWERYYPFIPMLIIPYWSIDVFFTLAPFFIKTRFALRQHVLRVVVAVLTAGFFFLNFPLTLAWPRPQVDGFLGSLFGALNNLHNYYNCAPSLHIALRTLLWTVYITPRRGPMRWALAVWFMLIGISTLLTWQHYVIDVLTGQLLGLLCLHVFPTEPPRSPAVDLRAHVNGDARVGRRYALVSLFLLALSIAGWPAAVLLLWPAAAFAVVALAYAGLGPGWLRKRADGTFPHSTEGLLAPYRMLAEWTQRHFIRALRLPAAVEATPGVLVGRRHDASAGSPEVAAVLDLTAEYPEHPPWASCGAYRNIPVLDLTAPSVAQLEEAVDFISSAPRPLLVHCSLGLGRSVTVGAAWLLASGICATVADAVARMREIQPQARLIPAAITVLGEFARRSR